MSFKEKCPTLDLSALLERDILSIARLITSGKERTSFGFWRDNYKASRRTDTSVLFANVTFSDFVKGLTCQSFSRFAL